MIRGELEKICLELHIKPRVLNRPVATRWNSLIPVIRQACDLRLPLGRLCGLPKLNVRAYHFLKLYPTEQEWALLVQLKPLLEVCASLKALTTTLTCCGLDI